jgi:hypothetical protein
MAGEQLTADCKYVIIVNIAVITDKGLVKKTAKWLPKMKLKNRLVSHT